MRVAGNVNNNDHEERAGDLPYTQYEFEGDWKGYGRLDRGGWSPWPVRGETVKLSSFGTFTVREKSQRIGRNPKTGVEVPIFAHRAVVFRASAIMKQKIQNTAKSNAPAETTEILRAIAADPVF